MGRSSQGALELALGNGVRFEDPLDIEPVVDKLIELFDRREGLATSELSEQSLALVTLSSREAGVVGMLLAGPLPIGLTLIGAGLAMSGMSASFVVALLLLILGGVTCATSIGLYLRGLRWSAIAKKADILRGKLSEAPSPSRVASALAQSTEARIEKSGVRIAPAASGAQEESEEPPVREERRNTL